MNENHNIKKIELKKIIPSWYQLSFCSRSPIFKSSIVIMFIIPIWARIANINPQETNSFTHYLIGFLDNNIPLIPKNLLRIFWASFSINVAYIIYTISCPKKYSIKIFNIGLIKMKMQFITILSKKRKKALMPKKR